MIRYFILFLFLFSSSLSIADESSILNSDSYSISQSTFGGIGLIQNPTARFSPDGEFGFGISTESPFNRLYAKVQVFPWLETVIRYTEETYQPYSTGARGPDAQTDKDKGIDFRIKLFAETAKRPALAFGLLDIGGTGAYGSEYLVANKRFNNIDLSLGMGWGRLGGKSHLKNPFGWIIDGHKVRNTESGMGGYINPTRWFTGKYASFFGGIEYYTPIENLTFKLEYDSSDYSTELGREKVFYKTGDIFEIDSPFNIGLNYQLNINQKDKIDFSIGYLRGNTFYANLTAHTNLNTLNRPKYIAPPEKLKEPYLEPFYALDNDWKKYLTELIIWQMGNEGIVTHNILFNNNELQVEISQGRFQKPIQAIDLASRILANNSPINIDKITIINIDLGIETLRATISRKNLVAIVEKGPLGEEDVEFDEYSQDEGISPIVMSNDYLYPNFFWSIRPHMNGTLQHQQKFYFWQLEALLHTEYSIRQGLYLTTDIGIDIDNNFEGYTYHIPDGELHHVRQDRRLYLTEGESGIRKMVLDYFFKFNQSLSGKISAGYLEWMYGGVGGEIIYLPEKKNWALGADAYWVKQRDFDGKFSFRDYDTVTGFLSIYYNLPFYDMRFKASAGKFLGKDKGVQVDISRRFKTGAKVGAIVSLTDCDSMCVGEGSFNKWIYFNLPMDSFYIRSTTRQKAGYAWSPLTKDAGTRVDPSGTLYDLVVNAKDEVDTLRRDNWSVKKIFSGFHTGNKL